MNGYPLLSERIVFTLTLQTRGNLLLLLTSFIWGTTFVAQMAGLDGLGPFTYASARYALGTLFLYGLWRYTREIRRRHGSRPGFKAGLSAGLLLFIANSMQQCAMVYTTAGKTAFITALYIVLVPLFASLFSIGGRVRPANWLGAAIALLGLYLLSIRGAVILNFGDVLVFISAFVWTAQILFISYFAREVDAIDISLTQTAVCLVGSVLAALLVEEPAWAPIAAAWLPIAYAGILSTGVAYTLQIVGQKYAPPSDAALIMSFEAVFGAVSSALLLGEQMSLPQILGCLLMFTGILVTQLPALRPGKKL